MIKRNISSVLILVLAFSFLQTHVSAQQPQKGPRQNGLDFFFYGSEFSCYNALKTGSIDIMAWPLYDTVRVQDAIDDLNILVTPATSINLMYGFNLNINETIPTQELWNSPFCNATFRRAVALLVNKNYIVSNIFNYQVERIDVPIPTTQSDWWNASVTGSNYPYEFNPQQAAVLLDSKGFRDLEGDEKRNYPSDWKGKPGQNLEPVILIVDNTDTTKMAMAWHLQGWLIATGIPCTVVLESPFACFLDVAVYHKYHIYVGDQFASYPPVYLALTSCISLIRSTPGRWATTLSVNQQMELAANPSFSSLFPTTLSQKLWTSPSYQEAMNRAKVLQGYLIENSFEVPVCNAKAYFAYRKNIAGIVNEDQYGLDNPYTYLNAYKVNDPSSPIRVGLVRQPEQFNILYSNEFADYQCLDNIYTGLLSRQPYNQAIDQPWVAQDWKQSNWTDPEDPSVTKTVIDYWFRKDVYWVKPGDGSLDGQFTAKDYEFTCYYIHGQPPYIPGEQYTPVEPGCAHYDRFKDIYNVTIIDDYHVKVYMNISSYYAYQWPTYPLLPRHRWLRSTLAVSKSAALYVGYAINLPCALPLGDNLLHQVVSGSSDTTITVGLDDGTNRSLIWGRDFTWKNGKIWVNVAKIDGINIRHLYVNYWENGISTGFIPGGLEWQEILEGCGTHYVTGIDSNLEWFTCSANRNFFLETPILGELDWAWNWQGTTQPRSGWYRIEIFDVVRVMGAYPSSGDYYPSANWYPAADLAASNVGHVDISDIVTVTSKYGQKFGQPP